jgi:glycosyltransferase involved in cell wall biosynthesis
MAGSPSAHSPGGLPSVSVAMATWNGAAYLPRQLESLAAQTLAPQELVVRDDGSTDRTLEILHDFAAGAPFQVTVLPGGSRLGYAQNFVTAGRRCSGDLVFFADQDDEWRPGKLAAVADAFRAGEPQAFFHDFALMEADGTEREPSAYAVLERRGLGRSAAFKGCTMAVNRTFLDLWDWPSTEHGVAHDFWIALLATAFGQRADLDAVLIDHRLHGEQESGWIPDDGSRMFTSPGERVDDVALLLDLVVKGPRVGAWTQAFLDLADRVGDEHDPAAAEALRTRLKVNRRRHRERRRARRAAGLLPPPRSSSRGPTPGPPA